MYHFRVFAVIFERFLISGRTFDRILFLKKQFEILVFACLFL